MEQEENLLDLDSLKQKKQEEVNPKLLEEVKRVKEKTTGKSIDSFEDWFL